MANLSITNTFVAGTTILAAEVNTNYTDVSGYINDRNDGSTDWDFVSSAGLITAKDGVRSSDETAATPAYSFTSDTDTGIYRSTTDTLNIATAGISRFAINTASTTTTLPLRLADGSAAAPTISFTSDTDTGLYRSTIDTLDIVTGGTSRITLNTASMTTTLPYLSANGTAAAPTYSFSGDDDTGMFWITTNQLGISAGGTNRLTVATSTISPTVPLRGADGTVGAPTYSFTNEPDMGMYRIGTDILGFSTSGTEMMRIGAAGIVTMQNQSGVSAQASAATSVPGTGADTKILFGTENYDIRGEFASSTFTATTAGIYLVTANVLYASPADGRWIAKLYKNGGALINLDTDIVAGGNTDFNCGGTALVQLAASDTLEIYASQNSGSAENATAGASTYFHIAKVA